MHTLEFDTREQQLKTVSSDEGNILRSMFRWTAPSSELQAQPVDRSRFFTNDAELKAAIMGLEIMLVARDEPADTRGVVRGPASLVKPGDVLTDRDVHAVLETDSDIGARLHGLVDNARTQRKHRAQSENWWGRFSDEKHFSHNVFETDPTEQVIIGRDQIEPVTVYNFGEKLRKRHIEGIIGSVAAMSVLTDGYSRAISPYIVIHNAFLTQHFTHSNSYEQAAGRAWLGEPFIEARRSSFDTGLDGSAGQPWVSQLIAHELSHQIEEEASPNYADFSGYFHYVDENRDGLVDYVKPKKSFASDYDQRDIDSSRPVRKYGYTNSSEDLATVGEELPFGGYVDRLRKDAYLEVIDAFIKKGKKKYGDMQPLPEKLKVEIARGGEIQLPTAASLVEPIKIRVDNTDKGNFLKRIFG